MPEAFRRPLRQSRRVRRNRIPSPRGAAQPQAAVAGVVGLSRRQRLSRLARDRVQRYPRGGRAHRRLSPLQISRLRPGLDAARRPRHHPRRGQARGRPRLLHVLVQRARPRRRRRHGRPPRRAEYRWTAADPSAALAADERARPGRRDRGRQRAGRGAGDAGTAEPRRARGGHRDVVGRPRVLRPAAARVGAIPVDVSRTGYTGDLGYEVWVESSDAVELWDALVEPGEPMAYGPPGCSPSTSRGSRRD